MVKQSKTLYLMPETISVILQGNVVCTSGSTEAFNFDSGNPDDVYQW